MSKILYVDDDASNLILFEALCENQFDVLTTDSGEKAIEILAREEVSVLLIDQRMPGMSGVELAEHAHKAYPDVVRILITAYSDLSEAVSAINRGHVRGYLRKPWNQEELIATLKEALDTFATRRRARELEMRMLATERVYTLGVVTAGVAHELRSPLAVLSSGATVVQQKLGELQALLDRDDCAEAAKVVHVLQPIVEAQLEAVGSMSEVCSALVFGNKTGPENAQCDLKEAVESAARVVTSSMHGRGNLHLDLPTTATVSASSHRVIRVLLNLMANAFAAMEDKGEAEVRVSLSLDGSSSVVDVRDNGPGVPDKDRERVFEMLFTTRGENGGNGLGLAISRRIAEDAGGTLECLPSEEGAHFRLTLPTLA